MAVKALASSLETAVNSISARKGCPSADSTVSFPKPAADAFESSNAAITAALSVFKLNMPFDGRLFECIFDGIEGIPFAYLEQAQAARRLNIDPVIVPGNFHHIIMDLGAQV